METENPTEFDEQGANSGEPAAADRPFEDDDAPKKLQRPHHAGATFRELERMIEFAVEYPAIGPALAELCFRINEKSAGERVLRMGLDRDARGVEYYLVSATVARQAGHHDQLRTLAVQALRAFEGAPPEANDEENERLLHLVRIGFSTLLHQLNDPHGDPQFIESLHKHLLPQVDRLGHLPFFHVLVAQTLWYSDKEASEASWATATNLRKDEHTWNAHGTWLKDAGKEWAAAEEIYRRGLDEVPRSALLRHNLAQLLVQRASQKDITVEEARKLCNRAEEAIRQALREESPRGLRRHIHATYDRLNELRASLPPPGPGEEQPATPPPVKFEVGAVVQGHIQSLTEFGAFVQLSKRTVGLLHKSEISTNYVEDPATVLNIGDPIEVKIIDMATDDRGKTRISLSRKALLPGGGDKSHKPQQRGGGGRNDRPERNERSDRNNDRHRTDRRDAQPQQKFLAAGKVSLGDMLMAKLKEQEKK